jgi:uncharacterized membrane protein
MAILILGIVLFLGIHSLPMLPRLRAGLAGRLGENGFKGLYSLVALAGFALIVWGFGRYRAEGWVQLWTPPDWTRHLTIVLMWFAFIALAAMSPRPSRIKGWLRHPMLVGVKVWALAHLLANGDLGGVILFASFLAWAIFDRISVKRRGDAGAARVAAFTRADAFALIGGTLAYGLMILLHPILIGVPVIG